MVVGIFCFFTFIVSELPENDEQYLHVVIPTSEGVRFLTKPSSVSSQGRNKTQLEKPSPHSHTQRNKLPKSETIRIQKSQSALSVVFVFTLHIHTHSYQVIQLFLILIYLSRLGKLRLGKRHTFELAHRQQVTHCTMILQEVAAAHPSRVKPILLRILDNVITLICVHSSPLSVILTEYVHLYFPFGKP